MGTGSGFFITENGYLVTNHHVIRPGNFDRGEPNKRLKEAQKNFDRRRKELNKYEKRLKRAKNKLDRHKQYMSGLNSRERAAEQKNYDAHKEKYETFKRDVKRATKEYKEAKREFDTIKRDYNISSSATAVARQFKVYLKNNKKLIAQLVQVSNKYDLALLKVEGYRVPYIQLESSETYRQGAPVYAIGAPLGMRDHMTSGIITSIKKHKIITDAKILPGNSGGPLVNEEGYVIGVNTQKLAMGSALNDGFGIAISAKTLKKEFSNAFP